MKICGEFSTNQVTNVWFQGTRGNGPHSRSGARMQPTAQAVGHGSRNSAAAAPALLDYFAVPSGERSHGDEPEANISR
jgi:hypothetical protein